MQAESNMALVEALYRMEHSLALVGDASCFHFNQSSAMASFRRFVPRVFPGTMGLAEMQEQVASVLRTVTKVILFHHLNTTEPSAPEFMFLPLANVFDHARFILVVHDIAHRRWAPLANSKARAPPTWLDRRFPVALLPSASDVNMLQKREEKVLRGGFDDVIVRGMLDHALVASLHSSASLCADGQCPKLHVMRPAFRDSFMRKAAAVASDMHFLSDLSAGPPKIRAFVPVDLVLPQDVSRVTALAAHVRRMSAGLIALTVVAHMRRDLPAATWAAGKTSVHPFADGAAMGDLGLQVRTEEDWLRGLGDANELPVVLAVGLPVEESGAGSGRPHETNMVASALAHGVPVLLDESHWRGLCWKKQFEPIFALYPLAEVEECSGVLSTSSLSSEWFQDSLEYWVSRLLSDAQHGGRAATAAETAWMSVSRCAVRFAGKHFGSSAAMKDWSGLF